MGVYGVSIEPKIKMRRKTYSARPKGKTLEALQTKNKSLRGSQTSNIY